MSSEDLVEPISCIEFKLAGPRLTLYYPPYYFKKKFLCLTNLRMLAGGVGASFKAQSIPVRNLSVVEILLLSTGATATNQYFLEKCAYVINDNVPTIHESQLSKVSLLIVILWFILSYRFI